MSTDAVIENILAFVDGKHEQIDDTHGQLNTKVETKQSEEGQIIEGPDDATVATGPPPQSTFDKYLDDKAYKSFGGKCLRANKFPKVIDDLVFNSEADLLKYRHDLAAYRKENRRRANEEKIKNSKMKLNALPEVTEEENVVEHEGLIYKPAKPYAVEVEGKRRRLPQTSKKDTKRIVEEVEKQKGKEGLKRLIKTKDEDEFQQATQELTTDSDEDFKNMLYNHFHNEFSTDSTFTKGSFLKFMKGLMEENQKLKKLQKQQQEAQQQKESEVHQKLHTNPFGLNPKLFE